MNPAVTIEEKKEMEIEMVVGEGKEMDMEMVPDMYLDIITGEFAYDPVRLPVEQDPTQLLYNRKTLQTIWETERDARNPLTRQWFDIKSAIPQTELRKEMKHFVELRRFPGKSVIIEYSITENQWSKIWKKINLIRLFCEFNYENIKLFISLHGFIYFCKVIAKP